MQLFPKSQSAILLPKLECLKASRCTRQLPLPKNGEHEWRPPAPSQYSTQFFVGLLTGSGFSFALSIFRARSAHSIIVQRSWVLVNSVTVQVVKSPKKTIPLGK